MPVDYADVAMQAIFARDEIRSEIYETPLIPAKRIGKSNDAKVLFKAENFQVTGSFKIRGATNKMVACKDGARLITASSGNHGIASSYVAKKLSKDLTVVLSKNVNPMKFEKIRSYGVKVIVHGEENGQAEQYAKELASTQGYTYISPYNDLEVIAGQGTIGSEILERCKHVDNVFISMGGGGLISGIGSVIKTLSPQTKIFGISAINSKALVESIRAKRVVETEHLETLADAVSGGIDQDTVTLSLATAVVDRYVDCNEDEIRKAMVSLAFDENMIVEGSAALALAGYSKVAEELKGQTSVLVLCGSNLSKSSISNLLAEV